ncbi:MAG: L-seryl-tRNA(Sec) selenium transferase, partial [Firmicutes bacterium]|nr:L-seryl-tRNA(Sec) selenium transferase [Bacillota bacterium]
NNAAAVLLALQTVAPGREVIVSRGQLVEIGGSFRIPEVMAASGAILVEVGTTNKTKLADYSRAINDRTALLLMVHPSNYRLVGFTASVSLEELISLGRERQLPVMFDAGSGYLLDLGVEALACEPVVQKAVQSGADLVTFSGDKLLGGPQAGIILGRRQFIARMRSNPLARALRIDKLSLAALEATLRLYFDPLTAKTRIPTWRRLVIPREEIERRAKALTELLRSAQPQLTISLQPQESQAGGGSLPEEGLPTLAVAIRHPQLSAQGLARHLRQNDPPIITRVAQQHVLLDPRTMDTEEFPLIAAALARISLG